jgi:hypothetical protein
VIVEADFERPPPEITTETYVGASVASAVLVVLLIAVGGPRLSEDRVQASSPAVRSECNDSGGTASMVARRYVELMGAERTIVATCWTPGRMPRELPTIAFRAPGGASDVTVHSSTAWVEGGVEFATVQVSGIWESDRAPVGWADRARRWILLRQMGDQWTIDAIRDGP